MTRLTCSLIMATVSLFLWTHLQAAPPEELLFGGDYEVQSIVDLNYCEQNKENDDNKADAYKHKLDLFIPKGKKDFPVLMFIHGGAWMSGDRKLYGLVGHLFARNGIGTVVISYRLSPKIQHPAHIQDVARAFAWTHKNIGTYGGRPDQIFVTGQSAGGHLAALLATNETYLRAEGLSLKDIKGAIPISGIYTFREGWAERIIGKGPEAAESASPIKHISGREPPFRILYAENDFPGCDTMSQDLCRLLQEKKVDAEQKQIEDRNHISIMFRLMFSDSDPTFQEMLVFIAGQTGMPLAPRETSEESRN